MTGPLKIGTISAATGAPTSDAAERQQIATAAREFEAMFLQQMLQQMRRSMLSEDVKEEGLGAATMTDTMDAELSRRLAGQSGGLYDVLVQAFSAHGTPGPAAVPAAAPLSAPRSVPAPSAAPGDAEPQLAVPEGRISSRFGWRTDPLTGGSRFHNGVDIAAAYGTDVPSAGAGRVVFAGVQGGYGQTVVLEHQGGVQTRYAHLSHLAVAAGDQVDRGTLVGRVGSSGRSTGAHLHFEVLEAGRPVDPVRAAEVAGGLKITAGAADYPRGTVRTVVSPEE